MPESCFALPLPPSFGCEEMNECPVPMPFTPLGDFIHEVGRQGLGGRAVEAKGERGSRGTGAAQGRADRQGLVGSLVVVGVGQVM